VLERERRKREKKKDVLFRDLTIGTCMHSFLRLTIRFCKMLYRFCSRKSPILLLLFPFFFFILFSLHAVCDSHIQDRKVRREI